METAGKAQMDNADSGTNDIRMKRNSHIFLLMAAVLALGTGCSKEEPAGNGGSEIRFSLSPIKVSSKAASSGEEAPLTRATTSFDQTQVFGSSAYSLPAGKVWLDDAASSEVFIDKEKISYNNGQWKAWTSGKNYYWKHDNTSLSFLSWYPYDQLDDGKLGITDAKEFSYTGWTMTATPGYGYTKDSDGNYVRNTADGSVDLLLAKSPDRTENDSANGVLIEFVHQLSNVRVMASIVDDPGTAKWKVTKVELSEIYTKANLLKAATTTVNTQIWGGHSDEKTYTYDTSTSPIELVYTSPATEVEIFPKTLTLPQSVYTSSSSKRSPKITVTCNYTETDASSGTTTTTVKTLTGVLSNDPASAAWRAGQSITYHISISTVDYWIDFDASASGWTEHTWPDGSGNIIIGE